jgi:uncharacterized protein (DUF433 family)
MVALEETITMPLVVTEQGIIRIKGSRVSLDSIVHHFKLGATAEQIVQSFPSLSLGEIYSSIAYYLTHRQEIEEYLEQQETAPSQDISSTTVATRGVKLSSINE